MARQRLDHQGGIFHRAGEHASNKNGASRVNAFGRAA